MSVLILIGSNKVRPARSKMEEYTNGKCDWTKESGEQEKAATEKLSETKRSKKGSCERAKRQFYTAMYEGAN